jgi:hypothetical protein
LGVKLRLSLKGKKRRLGLKSQKLWTFTACLKGFKVGESSIKQSRLHDQAIYPTSGDSDSLGVFSSNSCLFFEMDSAALGLPGFRILVTFI